MAVKVPVFDINAAENYWEGVHNAEILCETDCEEELYQAERTLKKTIRSYELKLKKKDKHLKEAQKYLQLYSTEIFELQDKIIYYKVRNYLFGQLSVIAAFFVGLWL